MPNTCLPLLLHHSDNIDSTVCRGLGPSLTALFISVLSPSWHLLFTIQSCDHEGMRSCWGHPDWCPCLFSIIGCNPISFSATTPALGGNTWGSYKGGWLPSPPLTLPSPQGWKGKGPAAVWWHRGWGMVLSYVLPLVKYTKHFSSQSCGDYKAIEI